MLLTNIGMGELLQYGNMRYTTTHKYIIKLFKFIAQIESTYFTLSQTCIISCGKRRSYNQGALEIISVQYCYGVIIIQQNFSNKFIKITLDYQLPCSKHYCPNCLYCTLISDMRYNILKGKILYNTCILTYDVRLYSK